MIRKAKRNDQMGRKIAEFAMASGDMQRIENYLSRGRKLESTEVEDLQKAFVAMFRAWGANPQWDGRGELDDVRAEYTLRGIEPPFALVKDDIDRLAIAAAELIEDMDRETTTEIGQRLAEEYFAAKKSQN
jgi:hypothetical protein